MNCHKTLWIAVLTITCACLTGTALHAQTTSVPAGSLSGPEGLALDSVGNLYIVDGDNHRIQKVTPGGTVSTLSTPGFSLFGPHDIEIDTQDHLFIADYGNGRILDVDLGTGTVTQLTTAVALSNPYDIVFDAAGNLYISEFGGPNGGKIHRREAGTGTMTFVDTGPYTPVYSRGMTFDSAGHMYIGDQGANRVIRIDAGTGAQTLVSVPGINEPFDVLFDRYDNLFVASQSSHSLYKVQAQTGTVTSISVAPFGLNLPRGLVFSDNNELYISNIGTNQVLRYAPYFTDQGPVANININAASLGVAWGDYDSDGDQDIYVANGHNGVGSSLFENDGVGIFADVAPTAGVNNGQPSSTGVWGDYDNDGDLDLYLANNGVNRLYRNEGNSTFSDRIGIDMNAPSRDSASSSWIDYNNDGHLDLFVANYGVTDELYLNDGTGTFTDEATNALIANSGASTGVAWGDYNGDGYPDLYVTRNVTSLLYANQGNGQFADVTTATINPNGHGPTFVDYNGDGYQDLYVTSPGGADHLYENDGLGGFIDIAGTAQIDDSGAGHVGAWGDMDNDGDLDLYLSRINGASNLLFENNGIGVFSDATTDADVANFNNSRGVAWGDADADGALDLFVVIFGQPNRLYMNNDITGNNYLRVNLEGSLSNRSGIGAVVSATIGGNTQRIRVDGGSSRWNQNALPASFGLGAAPQVDALTVEWPSGIVQNLSNVAGNQTITQLEVITLDVSIPHLTSPYDQLITVPVQVSETSGAGIVSAEVFICYDGDLITPFSSGLTGTLAAQGWSIQSNIEEGGQIDTYKIAMATDDDVLTGAGTLVNVVFQVANTRVPSSSVLQLKHVLFNDGTPGNTTTDGSLTITGNTGTITSLPATIIPRETVTVTVVDADLDLDGAPGTDNVIVSIDNTPNGDTINLTLNEDGSTAGTFSATYDTEFGNAAIIDALLQAKNGDALTATYADALDGTGAGPSNRTATTNVIGGADGSVEITIVSQPGDPLYIQVTDADLNTSVSSAQTASVTVENTTTNDIFVVELTEADDNDAVFFGSLPTTTGASTGTELGTTEDDIITVTYDDVVTLIGDQQDRTDINDVIFPWGDADDNDVLQAFDAAKILVHVLNGSPIDEQASNVDDETVTSGINPFDASLVLQKRVGLISTFPVQDPTSENHPQGTASPKLLPEQRSLSLVLADDYLSVQADERGGLLAGDLVIAGISGRVEMGADLADYLSASRPTDDGLRIVFAGAEAVRGPGELLRVYGVGPTTAALVRATFNNGEITGTASGLTALATPSAFALYPNMPNPFNPETTIRFELPQATAVKLEVFDILGQKVTTLISGSLPAGMHSAVWHGRNDAGVQVGNGVYQYRIEAGEFTQMRRMLLLK